MKKLLPLLLLFASGLYGQFTPPPVLATQAEAEAGTNNTKFMSPLRTAQAIAAQGGGGGAPTTATYITQTPNGGLSAEQALSLLGSGLVYNTTTTGVLSIVSSSTVGAVLRVTGANTFAFGAVDLADSDAITGTLPIANGGTASTTASAAVDALGGAAASGSGGLVRITGASLVTPALGAATGTSLVLSGAATASSFTASGSDAGRLNLPEGPATALIANTFSIYAGTDVAAGGLAYVPPVAAASGIMRAANSGGVMTISHDAGVSNLAASSSADLRGVLSDENGTGAALFSGASAAALTSAVLTTATITTSLVPTSNDGAALGSTSNQFSDLFLAEGGVINWDNGDATITQVGDVVTVAGAVLKTSTVGTASTSVATVDGTQTLTNKRVSARITSISSSATPTVNTDNCDCVTITALAAAITSMTSSLSGTPDNFDQLEYRILDNGTARAITWGASFASGTATLPTTTTVNKALCVYLEWDSVQAKWMCQSMGSYP